MNLEDKVKKTLEDSNKDIEEVGKLDYLEDSSVWVGFVKGEQQDVWGYSAITLNGDDADLIANKLYDNLEWKENMANYYKVLRA